MKVLVLGLDAAAPDYLFGDEELIHIRHLMSGGCYGRLESVTPPITVPAWLCMATSQDPGSLGIYGFRNRTDHSYGSMQTVNSKTSRAVAIWDQLSMEGCRSILVGVPPSFPPRKLNGLCVGCFLTPDTRSTCFTHPPELSDRIREWVGHYPVDVEGFRTDRKEWLRDQIFQMSRTQFEVVRRLMTTEPWDYFQFVDIGLDRVQHGFWHFCDPTHRHYEPGNPFETTIRDYYRHLDAEIGSVLECLPDDTVVLVVSDHGARKLEGGFCVNEWLIREGYLALDSMPTAPTRFDDLPIRWQETKAWGEGGYYARISLNVRGREPEGIIEPEDYERVRAELAEKLRQTTDEQGKLLGTKVSMPEQVYRQVHNVAPDLIVEFGALSWRSIGTIGHGRIHIEGNDTGPDDSNHDQYGAFILAAPGIPLSGSLEGVRLLDIAPTLLELSHHEIPPSMQGTSILRKIVAGNVIPATTDRQEILERLAGLGYIE
jgi:predicted AlkP superfamily phosphohydrolase/phosphomutase